MSLRFPTLFLPHGGGPCFFMDWDPPDTWHRMGNWLQSIPDLVGTRPRSLLVISAHWENRDFAVTASPRPELIYDYYGFPQHTYELQWPAPGAPELAERVHDLLGDAGIPCQMDAQRGLDHGVFIPLKLAFPLADIPVVQLSLRQDLDPAAHLQLGAAIAPLRDEGVLIVGSGMSYHNMQRFQRRGGPVDPDSQRFDDWLGQVSRMPARERDFALRHWVEAPGARESHPREEHLLPLHVVVGAAVDEAGECVFQDEVMGSAQSAFRFGAPARSFSGSPLD